MLILISCRDFSSFVNTNVGRGGEQEGLCENDGRNGKII